MGSFLQKSHIRHIIMNAKIAVLFAFVCAASGRVFLLDDFEGQENLMRVRRDTPGYAAPAPYSPPAPSYHAPAHKGRVGPVYTFVKTDPRPTSSGESDTGPEFSTE